MKISNIVGSKCMIKCLLNNKEVMALWDTGSQISIISSDFLKQEHPYLQPRKLEEILGTSLELRAANNSPIPYNGFVELAFGLTAPYEGDRTSRLNVPFLVADCNIANPIIGYNVYRKFTQTGSPSSYVLSRQEDCMFCLKGQPKKYIRFNYILL